MPFADGHNSVMSAVAACRDACLWVICSLLGPMPSDWACDRPPVATSPEEIRMGKKVR